MHTDSEPGVRRVRVSPHRCPPRLAADLLASFAVELRSLRLEELLGHAESPRQAGDHPEWSQLAGHCRRDPRLAARQLGPGRVQLAGHHAQHNSVVSSRIRPSTARTARPRGARCAAASDTARTFPCPLAAVVGPPASGGYLLLSPCHSRRARDALARLLAAGAPGRVRRGPFGCAWWAPLLKPLYFACHYLAQVSTGAPDGDDKLSGVLNWGALQPFGGQSPCLS